MQDALPALVLNSEALPRNAMSEPTPSYSNPAGHGTLGNADVSDEQLMLAFSKGSADSFSELFARYKQPIFGFFRRRVSSRAPSIGMQLRNATINGFRNASESVLGFVLFFAESGPTFLLWLAILLLPARLLWRRYQRAFALRSSLGV